MATVKYEEMIEMNGKCPICGKPFPCLDHFHGKVKLDKRK